MKRTSSQASLKDFFSGTKAGTINQDNKKRKISGPSTPVTQEIIQTTTAVITNRLLKQPTPESDWSDAEDDQYQISTEDFMKEINRKSLSEGSLQVPNQPIGRQHPIVENFIDLSLTARLSFASGVNLFHPATTGVAASNSANPSPTLSRSSTENN